MDVLSFIRSWREGVADVCLWNRIIAIDDWTLEAIDAEGQAERQHQEHLVCIPDLSAVSPTSPNLVVGVGEKQEANYCLS